jgi:hypothetical protein
MFVESTYFHPMGFLVLAILLAAAIASLLPSTARERIKAVMTARPLLFNLLYLVFAAMLVGYGSVRGVLALLQS